MPTDSTQCYGSFPDHDQRGWFPDGPRSRTACLTRRGLIRPPSPSGGGLKRWTKPTWWAVDQAQATDIAAAEGVTVRELMCPGCQRRADQLGVFPA